MHYYTFRVIGREGGGTRDGGREEREKWVEVTCDPKISIRKASELWQATRQEQYPGRTKHWVEILLCLTSKLILHCVVL